MRPEPEQTGVFCLAIFLILPFLSCGNLILPKAKGRVLCPENIALEAENQALRYSLASTTYLWGGQDELGTSGTIRIDCSGLAVNCYRHAVRGTEYALSFSDATVEDFYGRHTVPIARPRAGDVVFFGSPWGKPTHMGIFVRQDADGVWFVDSTFRPDEHINGVTFRAWPAGDRRIHSFGRVILRHGG